VRRAWPELRSANRSGSSANAETALAEGKQWFVDKRPFRACLPGPEIVHTAGKHYIWRMEKRWLLLLGSFIAFYYLIHVIYDMPNLVHGDPGFDLFPGNGRAWLSRSADIGFYFLFAFLPYLALWRWWPQRQMGSIVLLLMGLPLVFLLRYWMERSGMTRGIRMRTFFLNHLFYTLISLVFGIVFYFIRWSRYKELQQKDLEIQRRQAELSFLRSQINPHFLFNSLNNIYSLVYQGSGQALTAIAGLSDLLRYMLYDVAEKVPLATEMDYIQKYIALQQLRFDHPVEVHIKKEGSMDDVVIPPLLLIPFVENAFKHGDLHKAGMEIYLQSSKQKMYFHCTNRKGSQQKDPGGGIGLENVKRRLSLLYPGKHLFSIEEGPVNFSVNLELIYD
jgi:two-component system LytT family sensor kinase